MRCRRRPSGGSCTSMGATAPTPRRCGSSPRPSAALGPRGRTARAAEAPGRFGSCAVLVVVAQPLSMFVDEEVGTREAVALAKQALGGLAGAVRDSSVAALLSVSPRPQ